MTDISDGIQFRRDGVDPTQWPKLSCSQANQTALELSDLRLDAQREILFQGNGQLRASGDILFITGETTPEKLRILANGNVGIGTSSPAYTLDVNGIVNITAIYKNGAPWTLTTSEIADNAITATKIQDGSVGQAELAIGAVTELKIANNAVTAVKIADSSIGNSKLADGAVTELKIANSAVTEAKLAINAVTALKIADGSIGNSKLADGSVTLAKIDPSARPVWSRANSNSIYYNGGNVGIGTTTPNDTLDISGNLRILTGSNPIRFTSSWSSFGDRGTNQAEISNDTGTHKTLMIVGNRSAGIGRRVSIWDRLEVNGRMSVSDGVIQQGGDPITATADLGLYSQFSGHWMRFVTTNASFGFFSDGGAGSNPITTIDSAGNIAYRGQLTKLDVSEQFSSTVRVADFLLGHSGRRGSPGRALVDGGSVLGINWDADWSSTEIRSNLIVRGQLYVDNIPFGDRRNMQWDSSSKLFYHDNSSRKSKENITSLADDFSKILSAEPKTYTRPNNPDHWEIGYIAEEFHELGLEKLVYYDDDGSPGAINYPKLSMYLLEIIKKHEQTIKNYEQRIHQLEQRAK